ncbi:hypothetical protein [Abyssalbus ytuae]|uniref:Uncharacterized protein n=1 Tax=Abyssalbus ytuae TaxID=2926907 RepID=A0A9E6ZWC8_9FLAO|nr:hypothetical protein [Abyssalbus ytuae]UOB18016.1 hypothetical protein MQE35_01650 [Abyssalbus ytuae]
MAQDIRKLFEEERKLENKKMPAGHEHKFVEMLDKEFPGKPGKTPFFFLKIAASFVLLITAGYILYAVLNNPAEKVTIVDLPKSVNEKSKQLTLGDISPELKKIEDYYVTNINLELLDLDPRGENKKIIDKYLIRLSELNDEYKNLTKELNEIGPNEQTINALINNLQLRLQLLDRLKERLKELKKLKNETYSQPEV